MSRFLFFNLVILSLVLASTSCVSRKQLTYLQKDQDTDSLTFQFQRPEYRLQINDIVNIDIRSLNQEANVLFNATAPGGNQNLNAGDVIFYLQGYSVDNEGLIYMPVIGNFKVEGLTINQLRDSLDLRLAKYFQNGSVYAKVQLAGIRFSVVGDVIRTGKFVIYQNQANIFDALSMAGDITMVGDRREVQIIRQYPEGVKVYQLDLTDADVINDPRFFIQPNDIINVKPLKVKSWGIGTQGWQSLSSMITTLAATATLVFTINRLSE